MTDSQSGQANPYLPSTGATDSSQRGRYRVLAAGFFGWMLAGVQLGVSSIVMRDAAKDLLASSSEGDVGKWFGWLTGSFMLGAALGGYLFGAVGDRVGRKTAMAISIATYSGFAGLTYFVNSPGQLLLMRFLIGLGVGGMWPNGIALVAEAWPNMSRPMLAGVIGTAANVGIMSFSIVTMFVHITPDDWRWVMQWTAVPIVLAVLVWFLVPESARWLAVVKAAEQAGDQGQATRAISPHWEVFRRPILWTTLMGITLGTIPLFGGWGNANWANAWAAQVGDQESSHAAETTGEASEGAEQTSDISGGPALKAFALLARSAPGSLASLLGGAVATWLGRRRFYFFLCVACLLCSQYLFVFSHPARADFYWSMAALGLFSGFFFGWLPLCLPELFPTRIRATGAGVSFNFGRIATTVGILVAAGLLKTYFEGDYAQIGQLTGWIYAVGAVAICFAPDMGRRGLED